MNLTVKKSDAVAVARLAALAIRQAVKLNIHQAAIRSANNHLDAFVAAMEAAARKSKS